MEKDLSDIIHASINISFNSMNSLSSSFLTLIWPVQLFLNASSHSVLEIWISKLTNLLPVFFIDDRFKCCFRFWRFIELFRLWHLFQYFLHLNPQYFLDHLLLFSEGVIDPHYIYIVWGKISGILVILVDIPLSLSGFSW